MKSRLALLAVPFLALACSEAEQATLLEPPAISADVVIAAPDPNPVFGEEVRYWWDRGEGCETLASGSSAAGWSYPNKSERGSEGCLIAQISYSEGPVTKGQVVWQVCKLQRKGGSVRPKEICDGGGGSWFKFRPGVKVVNGEAWSETFGTVGCATDRTIGYRYIFKGGGQVKAFTSTPFNATNIPNCPT